MSGSKTLSDDEKREMLEDIKNVQRAHVFMAARLKSQEGSMNEYIDFLSENIELFDSSLSSGLLPTINFQKIEGQTSTIDKNMGVRC